jgi:hypothetical protein
MPVWVATAKVTAALRLSIFSQSSAVGRLCNLSARKWPSQTVPRVQHVLRYERVLVPQITAVQNRLQFCRWQAVRADTSSSSPELGLQLQAARLTESFQRFDVNFATSDGTANVADGDYVAASNISEPTRTRRRSRSRSTATPKVEGNETFKYH